MTDRRVVPFSTLAAEIGAGTPRLGAVRLVAIDGFGGAGKSVFAGRLSGALGGAPVVHTDAFATWDDQFDWWSRLERELLAPLADGRAARFRATDWSTGRDGPIVEVAPEPVVILEGVSSGRRAVSDRLTDLIWIEADPDVRLGRGIERDGEAKRDQWRVWMAEEDKHFAADGARDRARLIVAGAPTVDHDPEAAFVLLAERPVARSMSARRSAGILLYRSRPDEPGGGRVEVLLAHPGGPIFAKRDADTWTIPKGEFEPGESAWDVAVREFEEETGHAAPDGPPIVLGQVQQKGGKLVDAWALEGDLDPARAESNRFEIEWPPRSGRRMEIPEIDRVEWFAPDEARRRIKAAQIPFIDRLLEALGEG